MKKRRKPSRARKARRRRRNARRSRRPSRNVRRTRRPVRRRRSRNHGMTLAQARTLAASMGYTIRKSAGEYAVIPRTGSREQREDRTYYTDDLQDALDTARDMAHRGETLGRLRLFNPRGMDPRLRAKYRRDRGSVLRRLQAQLARSGSWTERQRLQAEIARLGGLQAASGSWRRERGKRSNPRSIARWDTRGKDYLELFSDDRGGYDYKGHQMMGYLGRIDSDEAAIRRMEEGAVRVLRGDRPSLKRTRNPNASPNEARRIIRGALSEIGVTPTSLQARTVGFSDLARASKVFVKASGIRLTPDQYNYLSQIARENGFIFQVSGGG